jgi:hypothetical protein
MVGATETWEYTLIVGENFDPSKVETSSLYWDYPPFDLHFIFEKYISKNGFDKLHFWSTSIMNLHRQ